MTSMRRSTSCDSRRATRRRLGDRGRAVALEPRRLQFARRHLRARHDLEGPLSRACSGGGSSDGKSSSTKSVEAVALPVQLLLQCDHLLDGSAVVLRVCNFATISRMARSERATDRSGRVTVRRCRELVESVVRASTVGTRVAARQGAGRQLRASLPVNSYGTRSHRFAAMPPSTPPSAFVVEDLLHPEARRRTVEEPEQSEVVVLSCARRQLDDRGRLLEHLPAAVEHEMVVRGDECEDDREGRAVARSRCSDAILVPWSVPIRPGVFRRT